MQRHLYAILLALAGLLAGGAAQADYIVGSGTSATAPLPAGSCLYVAQFVSAGVFVDRDLCGSFATALGINPQAPAGSNGDIQLRASATALSGLTPGAGIATWLATPSSANLATALTDETGSGALVFATSPALTTPNLGVPTAIDATNATNVPVAQATGTLGIAHGGTAATTAQAAAASLQVPYLLKNTGAASPHNGDTNNTILGWVNVPAGAMGANGCVDIAAFWGVTGSAGSWVLNVNVITGTSNGTTAGTNIQNNTVSAGLNVRTSHLICNLNDAAVQAMYQNAAGSFTASSNGYLPSTIDTTAAWTISINAKLNNGADTITLRHLHATLLYGG